MSSRSTILALIFLLAFGLLLGACGGGGSSAGARGGDDDTGGPPPVDDDSGGGDDDVDDDAGDDDTSGGGAVHIITPKDGDVIIGHQVSVQIKFDSLPDSFQMLLDGADLTYDLNYAPEQLTAWTDLQNVAEGDHTLEAKAWFGGSENDDSVSFSTSLTGAAHIELVLTDYTLPPGGSTTASWTVYDENNVDITNQVDVSLSVDPSAGVTISGNTITFANAGNYAVTASGDWHGNTLSDTTEVVVYPAGAIDHVVITCTPDTIPAGDVVTCQAQIYDANDHQVQGTMIYSVDPADGSTVNGNAITLTKAATVTITGTVAGTDVSDHQPVTCTAGPAYDVTLSLNPDTMKVNETTTATTSVVDQYGNPVSGDVILEVTPNDGIVIDGDKITAHKAGTFVVTAWDSGHTMQAQQQLFVTEASPPHIEIDSPARGAFVQTASINLHGRVWDDDSGIASLTVNGENVYFSPDTGDFTTTITLTPGLNIILLEAVDLFGNKGSANTSVMYAGSYLPNGDMVDSAIGAHITPTGFQSVEGLAEQMIEDYRSQLMGLIPNPLFSQSVDLLIVNVTASATATSINYTPVQVQLVPQPGGLHLHASTTSLDFEGNLHVVLDWIIGGTTTTDTNFSVTATSLAVDGDLIVGASGGQLQVQLTNVSVSIQGLNVQVGGGFTGDVLSWIVNLFISIVQGQIENAIVGMINSVVPPLLQGLLNGLDLSFDFDILDFTYHFTANFKDVTFDTTGGEVWLSAMATYGNGSWALGPNAPDQPGSLFTNNPRPTLGPDIPGTSTPYGFGVVLSDDIINQILHVATRSGLLSLNLDQATLHKLGIDNFQLTTTWLLAFMPGIVGQYGLGKNVEIRLRPLLPPVILLNPPQKTLDTEIEMGDFVLEWWCEKTPGNWELFMKVALALFIPTAISVDNDTQTIHFTFGDIEMYSDLFDAPVFEIDPTFVEVLLPDLVKVLMPALLNGLLNSFPIPSFQGFTLQVNAFMPLGAADDWAGLFGDLIEVPPLYLTGLPALTH